MLGDRSLLRLIAGALLVLALVFAGAFLGANIWPRVVTVERRVLPFPGRAAPVSGDAATADMIAQACPAVVAIVGADAASAAPAQQAARADAGSAPPLAAGFLVPPGSFVVTSADALPDGALKILLNDGRQLGAARAASDPVSGIALLKVATAGLPTIDFAANAFARPGETAVALSSPLGRGCVAEVGTIRSDWLAEAESLRSYLTVRPALDGRPSGEPVLNAEGAVIGIAGLPGAADSDGASAILPASTAAHVVGALMRSGGGANRFGLVADDLVPALAARIGGSTGGAMVSLVKRGSPAAQAGLKAGDLILAANGSPISGASELARALDAAEGNISLDIMRAGSRLSLTVEAQRQ